MPSILQSTLIMQGFMQRLPSPRELFTSRLCFLQAPLFAGLPGAAELN